MIELTARTVVLDLDDTLYLERDFARSGYAAVGRSLSHLLNSERFATVCYELLAIGHRGDIFDRALDYCGVAPEDRDMPELVRIYRTHDPDIALCDDVAGFLERFSERRIGLISDGPADMQARKLEVLGLKDRFDHCILTGQWEGDFGKPHPRAFAEIQERSGHSPEEHVYIADNATKDFLAPNQMGWLTIQLFRPGRIHNKPPPSDDHAPRLSLTDLKGLKPA
ncbi:HAD family hydrolase [Qipengyuania gelatinilytica]|uniref:HAD family hydrolase n=1 Tax=Qipengyuania gelatinilytica TaxID=2867231 RepID=A0ABX9A383_9SPHN|nr:HAD family hydrolase [Qipengyuania gelatinilytica]QZD95735.1 HAD family hydrolase [Qipengyuania gelatinilytica]